MTLPSNPSAHINRDDSERLCFSPASSAAWIRYKELESGFNIAPVSAMKKETRGLRLRKRVAGEGDHGILAGQQSGPERDGQGCDQRTCMPAPNYKVRVFPHTTKQFSDTGWLSPNPVLTLSAQRWHQIPQVGGSVPHDCHPPLKMPVTSQPLTKLAKVRGSHQPFLRSNLPGPIAELKKTVYLLANGRKKCMGQGVRGRALSLYVPCPLRVRHSP